MRSSRSLLVWTTLALAADLLQPCSCFDTAKVESHNESDGSIQISAMIQRNHNAYGTSLYDRRLSSSSTSCFEGYFLDDEGCSPCSSACKACSSATKCEMCFAEAYLTESKCDCLDFYTMTEFGCQPVYVTVFVSKLNPTSFLIQFSCSLARDLDRSDISLKVKNPSIEFTFELAKVSESAYNVTLVSKRSPRDVELAFTNFSFLPSSFNQLESAYRVTLVDGTQSSAGIDDEQRISKSLVRLGTLFFLASTIFTDDATAAFNLVNHAIYIVYLPLLKLNFPEDFASISRGLIDYLPFPNLLDMFFSSPQPSSSLSDRVGFTSAGFLIVAGKQLMIGGVLIVEFLLSCVASYTRLGTLFKAYRNINFQSRLSLYLKWLTYAFMELAAASVVQLGQGFGTSNESKLNFGCAVACLAVLCLVPATLCYIVSSYEVPSDQSVTDRIPIFIGKWTCWFGEFRQDGEPLSLCFYVFYYSKRLMLVLSALLLDNKMHQLVANVSASALCIAHIYAYFPYKTHYLNWCSIYAEASALLFLTAQSVSNQPGFQLFLTVCAFSGCASYLMLEIMSISSVIAAIVKTKEEVDVRTEMPSISLLSSSNELLTP